MSNLDNVHVRENQKAMEKIGYQKGRSALDEVVKKNPCR